MLLFHHSPSSPAISPWSEVSGHRRLVAGARFSARVSREATDVLVEDVVDHSTRAGPAELLRGNRVHAPPLAPEAHGGVQCIQVRS